MCPIYGTVDSKELKMIFAYEKDSLRICSSCSTYSLNLFFCSNLSQICLLVPLSRSRLIQFFCFNVNYNFFLYFCACTFGKEAENVDVHFFSMLCLLIYKNGRILLKEQVKNIIK